LGVRRGLYARRVSTHPPAAPGNAAQTEKQSRWRGFFRKLYEKVFREIYVEILERGPLWAFHLAIRGEIGPAKNRWIRRLTDAPVFPLVTLRSKVGFRFIAYAGPGAFVWLTLEVAGRQFANPSWWLWALAGALGVLTLASTFVLFFAALRLTRTRLFRRIAGWSYEDLFYWGALAIFIPALTGAVVTGMLVDRELIPATGVPVDKHDLPFRTFETFTWSLADSIPVLKIPETLNWNRR
jgi:hypothetical protein